MSIIVEGLKMPERCASCNFLKYDDWANGNEYQCTALNKFMDEDDLPEGRRDDCPLVELIRCKDCMFGDRIDPEKIYCDGMKNCWTDGDSFCAWAYPKRTGK